MQAFCSFCFCFRFFFLQKIVIYKYRFIHKATYRRICIWFSESWFSAKEKTICKKIKQLNVVCLRHDAIIVTDNQFIVDLIEIYWPVSFFLKEKIAKMLTRIQVTVMWTRHIPVTIRTKTEFFVISIKVQQKSLRMAIETVCLRKKRSKGTFISSGNKVTNYIITWNVLWTSL